MQEEIQVHDVKTSKEKKARNITAKKERNRRKCSTTSTEKKKPQGSALIQMTYMVGKLLKGGCQEY